MNHQATSFAGGAAVLALVLGCTARISGNEASAGGSAATGSAAGAGGQSATPPSTVAFTCDGSGRDAGPRRLWRLSGPQYLATIKDVLSSAGVRPPATLPAPFDEAPTADRFSTASRLRSINGAEFRSALETTTGLSALLVSGAACGAEDGACFRDFLQKVGARALRRPLTAEEAARYAALATDNTAELGVEQARGLALQAVLMAPELLFRTELGDDARADGATVPLTPYEVAAAISYTLVDSPPDEALRTAAANGELSKPEQIDAHVARLVANLSELPTALRFVSEYFRIANAGLVFKDPALFPSFRAGPLIDDANAFISHTLADHGRSGLLHALLSSEQVYPYNATWKTYGVPEIKGNAHVGTTAPAGQRSGLLTAPAWLIAYSAADDTQPVQRGRFIAESLLCETIPAVPIGFVPVLPPGEMTMRERLALHSQGACAQCHQLMDPLGLAFEHYDHLGVYRESAPQGELDTSGRVTLTNGEQITYQDGVELSRALAASPAVEQCFVRHSFRYWMGRTEAEGDSCALLSAERAYQAGGGDYLALLQSLLDSPSFLRRHLDPPTERP